MFSPLLAGEPVPERGRSSCPTSRDSAWSSTRPAARTPLHTLTTPEASPCDSCASESRATNARPSRTADEVYDLGALTADIDGDFLAGDGIRGSATPSRPASCRASDVAGQRLGAADRPADRGALHRPELRRARRRVRRPAAEVPDRVLQAPEHRRRPVRRHRSCRRGAEKLDWEVELGVVIGSRARYLESPEDARGRASPGTPSPTTSPSAPSRSRSPAGSGRRASAARRSTRSARTSSRPTRSTRRTSACGPG